jgi:hypothetical protein
MTDTVYLMPLTFGFGPASHAFAIAQALRSQAPSVRIVAVADGIAANALRVAGIFDEVAEQHAGDTWPSRLQKSTHNAVAISVGDFERARAATQRAIPVIVVDALYWMWDRDPLNPRTVDRYFCLAFPGVDERLARLPERGPHVRVIPQIVAEAQPASQPAARNGILLNFGGVVSPHRVSYRLLSALAKVIYSSGECSAGMLITCSGAAAAPFRRQGLPPDTEIIELSFSDMIRELGGQRRLYTLPGLSSVWQALAATIPTVLIPPANYSQHRQVASFRQFIDGMSIITWDDLDGYACLPPGLPEPQGAELAADLGDRFADDESAQSQLASILRRRLRAVLGPARLRGNHPWNSFDGAHVVATEALALLAEAG